MKLVFSDKEPQRLAIKLKPKGEKAIKQHHPWIFDASIDKCPQHATTGDLAIIFDQKKNKFLAIGLFDQDSPIRIKIIHIGNPTRIDANYWKSKIIKALDRRSSLLTKETNSFRWIYGESDGFPGMIVDVYDKVAVVKIYSAIWLPYLSEIIEIYFALRKLDAIVLRFGRLLSQEMESRGFYDGMVVKGKLKQEEVTFIEHGLTFKANVIKGHKTGFFLDHRHNRKRVGELSYGKSVLDVFSYAGGFSTHALAGGAKSVTSLDISPQAQKMAKENIAINGLQNEHKTIVGDAFVELSKLIKAHKSYDLVIIDPPSFAKSTKEISGALRSYRKLAALGGKLVQAGGILVMASCSSRIKAKQFFALIEATLAEITSFQIMEKTGHDVDHPIGFPEAAYLKTGYYRIF